MVQPEPIIWVENKHAREKGESAAVSQLIPNGISSVTRRFHTQIPGYQVTPLKNLSSLARHLNVGSIWVKDESIRMGLNAFKALGGSFAIYQLIRNRLGADELTYSELMSDDVRRRVGDLTFTSATDGNHGKGLAWAARKLRFPCVIYVHKDTSRARIDAIAEYGAEVRIINGTYDDAVRQCTKDAQVNGWQVISDTSWSDYEAIPAWVMQGYTTLLSEVQEQLSAQGLVKPTHVFVQAGVGAFAAAVLGFYRRLFGQDSPMTVVVEPATAACLYHSAKIADGQPHAISGSLRTIMAGLACGEPSPLAWKTLWDCADVFLASPDYVAAKGMRIYGVPLKGDPTIISGESGAVTLGALTFIMQHQRYRQLREYLYLDENSALLLINTEGNTDPGYFRQVVWEGCHSVPKQYR